MTTFHHHSPARWCLPTVALACAAMFIAPHPAQAGPPGWLQHLKQAQQAVQSIKQIKDELVPESKTSAEGPNMSGQAVPLPNGDFEYPAVPSGRYVNFTPAGRRGMPGWTVVGPSGRNVSIISGAYTSHGLSFPAERGAQWLDLTGYLSNRPEGVRKVVTTVAGRPYTLSFYIGNVVDRSGMFGTSSTVAVRINGGAPHLFTNYRGIGSRQQVWQRFTLPFTATSSATVITFVNRDPQSDNSNGLDGVSVTMIQPRPAARP